MAVGTPLTRITFGATSVADDLGYVALADLARALGGTTEDYRVIGGHMVTVLAARWQLGHDLYRETGDVDLGIPPIVARDHNLVNRLKDLEGYSRALFVMATLPRTAACLHEGWPVSRND
jgi:hypothetical protein